MSFKGEENNRTVLTVKKEKRFEKQKEGCWKLIDWSSKNTAK